MPAKPVGGTGYPRLVGPQAVVGQAVLTVLAVPAADVERGRDHVADLNLLDGVTDLDDLAEVLVTKDLARLETGAAFVHVQVRAADVGAGDPHQHIGGLFDAGVGDLIDADLPRPVIHHCFHGRLPSCR
jgi:hypothetical protein